MKSNHFILLWLFITIVISSSCKKEDVVPTPFAHLSYTINSGNQLVNVAIESEISITFNFAIDTATVRKACGFYGNGQNVAFNYDLENENKTLKIIPISPLKSLARYDILIDNQLLSIDGKRLEVAFQLQFVTTYDDISNKKKLLSDNELLDTIQYNTLKYFWDFGHPKSGMARERNTSGDLVTSGGTGMGIMAMIVGVERGWYARNDVLIRLQKIVDFLEKADRFHGVFPHWMNGVTGKTIPFSPKDDGGDLVETSFLMAGMLTASEYFSANSTEETNLRTDIDKLWREVEWSWYTKGGDQLYWHWSPIHEWAMNHVISGWNEALITYVLAASSPTFPISKSVYDKAWTRNGAMKNGKVFYNVTLPLGPDQGGPLFFSHYSFLGINPNGLKDGQTDYGEQCKAHTLINYHYCVANPRKFSGYSAQCWGLTASDSSPGYSAHSPTNDLGVISPTAALSSMPYTPVESMAAAKYFYYKLGDKIWGQYGFVDAFNLSKAWIAPSFLAIDQGPIIVMIENHRSGLLWNLMKKNDDVTKGLSTLGFTY